MDEIRFEVEGTDVPAYDGPVDTVSIFINGRDLVEQAREVELPFAARRGERDLAGDYIGLPSEEMLFPSRRLLGEPETYYDADYADGMLAVLGCVCGDVGCWPLLAGITAREDVVVWNDFRQPHRSAWKYDALGLFVFDRGAYEAALRGA